MIRVIIQVSSMGPCGDLIATEYKTVDIKSEALERALTEGNAYQARSVVGVEIIKEKP